LKNWQKILSIFAVTLIVGGGYLLYVWHQRSNPGVAPPSAQTEQPLSRDEVALVRPLSPQHFEDMQPLVGTRIWMKNGYTIPYFPYANGAIQFSKKAGLIPAAQPMDVKKFVKSAAPASVDDGMEHGTRQAFAMFSLPGDTKLYATPVGSLEGDEEHYFADLLFYYDDPHTIYSYWPKDVWAAIDAHQVKAGMSELETRMAIGQKIEPDGQDEGDRTVSYDQEGKHWIVTYVKNRATTIKTP
jgi:hypothetical protein